MKKIILALFLVFLSSWLYGQNTTNNNTVIIHGNVYYFQPSNTPSSPQPAVGGRNSIARGSWYGENAARAWASISDWVIERSRGNTAPVTAGSGERAYISSVHAFPAESNDALSENASVYVHGGVVIRYWIVRNGDQMENGRRATRNFWF